MVAGSYGTENGTGTAPTGMITWKPIDSPVLTLTIWAVPKASGSCSGSRPTPVIVPDTAPLSRSGR